ncbi:hypothetical protein MPC4_170007 [Methylocella tundrae]|uniref:Uncharacterized protein n=1 Tax=Methylocella tundrae TaxID=227605 RepID=A0A8B6M3U6_METTU|nr:hypothetical protein [Methylocella tundrae]VTZ49476.1 hypothetical protein MPC4_170007 [Methylocella tundrae]
MCALSPNLSRRDLADEILISAMRFVLSALPDADLAIYDRRAARYRAELGLDASAIGRFDAGALEVERIRRRAISARVSEAA